MSGLGLEGWRLRLDALLRQECATTYERLNQGQTWIDKDATEHPIAEMDSVYRYICARHLRASARRFATRYTLGEAMAGQATANKIDSRDRDPVQWVQATALHTALVEGLPDGVRLLANHYSGCPVRTVGAQLIDCACHRSTCEQLHGGISCTCKDPR